MSGIDIQEQRHIRARFPAVGPRVHRADDDSRLGNLVNLTTEGLLLMGADPVAVGKELPLCIRWPGTDGENQEIHFQARSRWCQTLGNPAFHITGFAISRITTEELDRVLRLICTFGFQEAVTD